MKKTLIEASLLLVDDDPTIIQVLSRILSDYSSVRFATTGADALQLADEERPDLILLDAQLGDMSGLQVCEALKADLALADIPVIFVSSLQESELEVAVLEMGAVDFIRKPFNASQVTARVNMQLKLKRLADDLRQLSRVDALTALPNERALDEQLARELLRGAESKQSLSVVLVLPDTPADAGLHVANRVLEAVEALDIAHLGSDISRHVTCSAGVALFDGAAHPEPEAEASGELLRRAAAEGLAQAKQAGHAQACLIATPAE